MKNIESEIDLWLMWPFSFEKEKRQASKMGETNIELFIL